MKKRNQIGLRVKALVTAVILVLLVACSAVAEVKTPFLRLDRDKLGAWQGELDNVRTVVGDRFEYQSVKKKYGIDPEFQPASDGLDTLCISGSAQFSTPQFRKLAATLRECAGDKTVYIIDLRQESHVLVNEGIPISWYGKHNWGNEGKTLEQIEADEAERFGALIGSTVSAYARSDDEVIDEMVITVESVMTEKELVESEGFKYLRLPIRDHSWPAPETIDTFVSFVKSIDRSWLHFHCQAGNGRTGLMMILYDMMMNPGVPMYDIVVRQTKLGASYVLYTEDSDNYKVPLYAEKAKMTPLFYEYVQQQHGANYEVPWSVWLKEHTT